MFKLAVAVHVGQCVAGRGFLSNRGRWNKVAKTGDHNDLNIDKQGPLFTGVTENQVHQIGDLVGKLANSEELKTIFEDIDVPNALKNLDLDHLTFDKFGDVLSKLSESQMRDATSKVANSPDFIELMQAMLTNMHANDADIKQVPMLMRDAMTDENIKKAFNTMNGLIKDPDAANVFTLTANDLKEKYNQLDVDGTQNVKVAEKLLEFMASNTNNDALYNIMEKHGATANQEDGRMNTMQVTDKEAAEIIESQKNEDRAREELSQGN